MAEDKPTIASSRGEAVGTSSAHGVGSSIAEATGNASLSMKAEAGSLTLTGHDVELRVGRAPFSEPGMAERFSANPNFYRNLAAYVASEIRREAESVESKGNLGASTKSQLNELADGFNEVATGLTADNGVLTPEAASAAAALVTGLRSAYAAIVENHPELIKLTSIGLAAYALSHFGNFDLDLSLLISTAVVTKEKLSDIMKAWKHGK